MDHECSPPEGRQPLDIKSWTCPDCGRVWDVRPHRSTSPSSSYDVDAEADLTPAKWVGRPDRKVEPMEQQREREPDDTSDDDEQAAREDSGTPGQVTPPPSRQGEGEDRGANNQRAVQRPDQH